MIKRVLFLTMVISLCVQCTKQEVSLNRSEMKVVDTLYRHERDLLQPILEDSCATLRSIRLEVLIDSIREVRIQEIRKMIRQYE